MAVLISPEIIESVRHHRVAVIVGPTAIGKTAFSIDLARIVGGEILSADSMQVYRYMDIGTAKVDRSIRHEITHYGIDVCDPDQSYSVGRFVEDAESHIGVAKSGGAPLIICGGTGLYVHALLHRYVMPSVPVDPVRRHELNRQLLECGSESMWTVLRDLDPESAADIHPHHSSRVVRAIELIQATGGPLRAIRQGDAHRRSDCVVIGLTADRDVIWQNIFRRVGVMIESGLVDEVEALLHRGYSADLPSMKSIGYRETVEYLNGTLRDLDSLHSAIAVHTRQFSKRQMTWFKRLHYDYSIQMG